MCCSFSYEDEKTKKTYKGKVAFQVLVSPGSYEEGPTTLHNKGTTIDPKFDNSKIEWSTTERGSIIIYGLLIRLEEDNKNNWMLRDLRQGLVLCRVCKPLPTTGNDLLRCTLHS